MLYFAYGSNMNIQQMQTRIGNFKCLGKYNLNGYCLAFDKKSKKDNSIGFANIIKSDSFVEGVLYELDSLDAMDKFEGYPNHYRRIELEVCNDIECRTAWVYVANENMRKGGLNVTNEYFQKIVGCELLSKNYRNEIIERFSKCVI